MDYLAIKLHVCVSIEVKFVTFGNKYDTFISPVLTSDDATNLTYSSFLQKLLIPKKPFYQK